MWRASGPPFPYLQVSVVGRLVFLALEVYLQSRQISRYGETIPSKRVSRLVPLRKFLRSQNYGRARALFSLADDIFHSLLGVLFALCFVHPQIWQIARRFARTVGYAESELIQTVIFFAIVNAVEFVLDLPGSIYSIFVVEARFGFNRTSVRTFIVDKITTIALSVVIGVPVLAALHSTLEYFASTPPLVIAGALWSLIATVIVIMMFLVPSVIAPLFNKYTPLDEGSLRSSLESMARRLKFPLGKIYVIDGSKRSSHSNAFFAGIFSKFICIYDSLLEETKGNDDQVVAVLCHELGHWACSHTMLGLLTSLVHLGLVCLLYGFTAGNPDLFRSFGYMDGTMPKIIGLVLFSEMLTPLDALLKPLCNLQSRHYEYQADKFAKDQGMGKPLAHALVSMHINNLSNMVPDPMYAAWNYSHPTLLERLDALDVDVEVQNDVVGGEKEE